jgi:hypothetical protein
MASSRVAAVTVIGTTIHRAYDDGTPGSRNAVAITFPASDTDEDGGVPSMW